MAHPREYDRESLVPAICERLAQGEPLAVICRDIGIPRRTVNQWRQDDEEIAAQFDEARDDGFDVIAQRLRTMARGDHRGGKDSLTLVQRDKLAVETDLKLLSKWDPRRYGDRMALTGADGGAIKLESHVSANQAAAVLQEGLRALEKLGSES